MNVCLHAFGTEEAEFLGRDGREESVAHKIHASNSHVLKSRLCERDKTKSKVAPFRTVSSFYFHLRRRGRTGLRSRRFELSSAFAHADAVGALPNRWTAAGRNGSSCENLTTSMCFPVDPNNRTLLSTIASTESGPISDIPASAHPSYALDYSRLATAKSRDRGSPGDGAISWLDRAGAFV